MKVDAGHFTHQFNYLSANELFFDRLQNYSTSYEEIDVYGSFWSFLFASLPPEGLGLSVNEAEIHVSGRMGIFIPPHAVVHWKVKSPQLHWFAYACNLPVPENFPKVLTIYPLKELPHEASPEWVRQLVASSRNTLTLPRVQCNSYTHELKRILDQEFRFNTPLQVYADQMGLSKEWLIKYFKKSYGLSPVDYRNKKRVMEALFSLHVRDEKIIDLSCRVGFNDLKQFNDLFKKVVSLPPSKFLPRRESELEDHITRK